MTKELEVIDHAAEGLDNILKQYKDSPLFKAFLEPMLSPMADFETQFTAFKSQLTLDVAEGENLDLIGDMLNAQSRPVDDEDYRNLLKALVIAYNSSGTANDIIKAINLIIEAEETKIVETYEAGFAIEIKNISSGDVSQANRIVRIAKGAGIEFIKTTVTNYTPYFGFEEDADPDSGTFDLMGENLSGAGYYSLLID